MQNDIITLSVDELNDGATTPSVDHVFTRFEEYQNRSVYIGSDHSLSMRNTLGLYRTMPKINGNYRGSAKSSVKFTFDIEVPGVDGVSTIIAPQIIEVSCSNPVGATPAQTLLIRQKAVALLDLDAVVAKLNDLLLV